MLTFKKCAVAMNMMKWRLVMSGQQYLFINTGWDTETVGRKGVFNSVFDT